MDAFGLPGSPGLTKFNPVAHFVSELVSIEPNGARE
jgi:hypothetical protein